MTNRPRWWLVVPALLASAVVIAASSTSNAGEIRDKAGLFSTEAVQKSLTELDRLEKEYEVPMTIETVESLNGETISDVTTKHAQAVNARGIYLLVSKNDSKMFAEASRDYRKYVTRERLKQVEATLVDSFKKRDFDAGLAQGVAKLGSVLSDAKLEAGGTIRQAPVAKNRRGGVAAPVRQAPANKPASGGFSLMTIILGILGVWLVIRLLSGLMGMMRGNSMGAGGQGMMGGRGGYPGQGGPGYGGGGYGGAPAGGGGFMSSMFGGIGGALAGNYLYDQFSGRNHGGGVADQTGVDAGAGAAPIEDAGPEWGGGGAEADYGGTATDNSAGGDWGGGGGGGDAGGDWGGGGGGDAGGDW